MKKATQALPNQELIDARLRRGWSQQEVADRIGTTSVNVSRWERGATSPSPYFRQQLCVLFDASAHELGFLHTEKLSFLAPLSEPNEQAKYLSSYIEPVQHVESGGNGHAPSPLGTGLAQDTRSKHGTGSAADRVGASPTPTSPCPACGLASQVCTIPTVPPEPSYASASHKQNRLHMLRRLHHSYSDLMSRSLQGTVWLDLGLTKVPNAVQNVASLLLRTQSHAEQDWPAGTSILEAYNESGHELLIVGEPGTGKSTLLLDLAQRLVLQAEQDETNPLPVILPLSSWAVKRLPLQDWIVEKLRELYGVPHKVSTQWVREEAILPLLDGLDEMEESARPACIAAINTYRSSHLLPLVVCGRKAEYEAAASHESLTLQSAVVVQPLTPTQVESYLVQAGEKLAPLHCALKEDPSLQALVTTPLMLNVLVLTYQGKKVDHLPKIRTQLQHQAWTNYVARMVERRGEARRYSHSQIISYLCWLARQMKAHNRTVFYLEHQQPSWLDAREQRIYRLLVFVSMSGLAPLRHYIVRFLLWRTRRFPWRAVEFLNDATARILLGRVDGGYSFIHSHLLDYFASLDDM
jgi:transcriptional regulator with XRE-family HTH domain/DNA polymerase III delta prime subunit